MEENSINTSVSENYQSEPVYTDNSIDFEETNYPTNGMTPKKVANENARAAINSTFFIIL